MLNADGFCSGLKPSKVYILLETYRLERKSKEDLENYINYLKSNDNYEYNDFLSYKQFVETRTPNLKEIFYEFLDGKLEKLDFDLFNPHWKLNAMF